MNKEQAYDPFEKLRAQLEAIADGLGMNVESFGVLFDKDPELTMCQCVFSVRPEAVMSEAEREQAAFDKQFAELAQAAADDEYIEKKAPIAKADIESWLDGK